MLHIINKSPFLNGALESCIRFLNDGDTLILIEDAVYAAMTDTDKSNLIEDIAENYKVYATSADLSARGIDRIIGSVEKASYEDFVDLIEKEPTQSWL